MTTFLFLRPVLLFNYPHFLPLLTKCIFGILLLQLLQIENLVVQHLSVVTLILLCNVTEMDYCFSNEFRLSHTVYLSRENKSRTKDTKNQCITKKINTMHSITARKVFLTSLPLMKGTFVECYQSRLLY
jgi:hypothetical protein